MLKIDPITMTIYAISCTGFQSANESSTLYTLCVLVYKCLHGSGPSCLADMISAVGNGCQRLRSAAHGNLAVPRTQTVLMGPRSFAVSGPTLWNSLHVELKTRPTHISLETFN